MILRTWRTTLTPGTEPVYDGFARTRSRRMFQDAHGCEGFVSRWATVSTARS